MAEAKEITTLEEWQSVYEGSSDKPLVVFKHSTTCPVSANAYSEFQSYLKSGASADADYVLVKVIESRPVSNRIAEDTGVKHESPQIICVKNKEKYWTASHWSITEEHINAVLN